MMKSSHTNKNNKSVEIKNHSECMFSQDPVGNLTAGQGKLDYWGYWEQPCSQCKKEMEEKLNQRKL